MSATTTPILDLERGFQLACDLQFDGTSEDIQFIFDGRLGDVEFTIHEIGHALTMGIDIRIGFGDQIDKSPLCGPHNEAMVLVAEEHLFRWLEQPIDPMDIETCGEMQDVPVEMIHELRRSFAPCRLAHRLLTWLRSRGIITEHER